MMMLLLVSLPLAAETIFDEKVLYEFKDDPTDFQWYAVNDTVMGGKSQSGLTMLKDDDIIVFFGNVSLANNGGFASVRSAAFLFGIDDYDGISLKIRGDGKSYKLRLQTNVRSSVSYEQSFETTAGEWIEVKLRFEDFVPVFFGREAKNTPKLDPGDIRTFGIMISDKQEGDFRIEIDTIAAFRFNLGSEMNMSI
jgi:monofunctional biosynthetic peptidoglycan transglycosylase